MNLFFTVLGALPLGLLGTRLRTRREGRRTVAGAVPVG